MFKDILLYVPSSVCWSSMFALGMFSDLPLDLHRSFSRRLEILFHMFPNFLRDGPDILADLHWFLLRCSRIFVYIFADRDFRRYSYRCSQIFFELLRDILLYLHRGVYCCIVLIYFTRNSGQTLQFLFYSSSWASIFLLFPAPLISAILSDSNRFIQLLVNAMITKNFNICASTINNFMTTTTTNTNTLIIITTISSTIAKTNTAATTYTTPTITTENTVSVTAKSVLLVEINKNSIASSIIFRIQTQWVMMNFVWNNTIPWAKDLL